jgi:hypothetical protein
MILGFTGTSRGMTHRQHVEVADLFQDLQLTILHHGDCVGSDQQAHDIAVGLARIIIHPPLDKSKRAFCIGYDSILPAYEFLTRNKHIVRDSPGGLIATPRQDHEVLRSGTWQTIRYAMKLGRTVWIVFPNGSVKVERPVKNRSAFPER